MRAYSESPPSDGLVPCRAWQNRSGALDRFLKNLLENVDILPGF